MKKLLFSVAAAALVAFGANAQTWDFTGLQGVTPTTLGSQGFVAASGSTIFDAITSGDGGSAYGAPVTYASLSGVGINVKNSAANAAQLRLYPSTNFQAGLFGNGSDCLLTFSNIAEGKYIHVTFAQKGSTAVSTALFNSKLPTTATTPMGGVPGEYVISSAATPAGTVNTVDDFVTGTLRVTVAGDIMLYFSNAIISKVVINDSPTASIGDQIEKDGKICTVTGYFNLLGQNLGKNAPEKGVYIETYSNCPAQKIVK